MLAGQTTARDMTVNDDVMAISQRTVVRMINATEALELQKGVTRSKLPAPIQYQRRRKFWVELLYEHDFPNCIIERAEEFRFNFREILRYVQDGQFLFPTGPNGPAISGEMASSEEDGIAWGSRLLGKLAAILVCIGSPTELRLSLERDGYSVDCSRMSLVPLEGAIKIQEEDDRFRQLIRTVKFPNGTNILKHLTDATDLFSESGKEHPCINESRSFLQSLIDDISEETNRLGGHSIGLAGNTKDRFEYLQNVGFFSADERAAFGSAWGALSAGSHPGVPPRDEARIGLILAIEFGQLLVLKFKAWSGNNCKNF